MFTIKIALFLLTSFEFFIVLKGLQELRRVKDNSILDTEETIRYVAHKLFSFLTLNISEEKNNCKRLSAAHDYLILNALQDYNNTKEIVKHTRVEPPHNASFITKIVSFENESVIEDKFDLNLEIDDAVNDINNFVTEIRRLRNLNSNINAITNTNNISKFVGNDNVLGFRKFLHLFAESAENDSISDESDFWVPPVSSRRVYGGERTKIKHFPFMAVVLVLGSFQCAGSIIKDDLVITAASCLQLAWNNRLFRENPSTLSVRVGSRFYTGGGEIVPVMEVYFHPSYNPRNLKHNLCILRLMRKLNFRKKTKQVKRIDFDRSSAPLPTNVDGVTIVGWGPRNTNNKIISPWHNPLTFAVLDYYPFRDCQDVYGTEYVTNHNFCAGFVSKSGGACNRDAGGPGVVHGRLAGVVSFGSPVCGALDAPTVFTKVGYYTEWIEDIMEQDVPSYKVRTTTFEELDYDNIKPPHAYTQTIRVLPLSRSTTEYTKTTETEMDINTTENDALFKYFLKTFLNSKELDAYHDDIYKDIEDNIIERPNTLNIPPKRDESEDFEVTESYTDSKKFTILGGGSDVEFEHERTEDTSKSVEDLDILHFDDDKVNNDEDKPLIKDNARNTDFKKGDDLRINFDYNKVSDEYNEPLIKDNTNDIDVKKHDGNKIYSVTKMLYDFDDDKKFHASIERRQDSDNNDLDISDDVIKELELKVLNDPGVRVTLNDYDLSLSKKLGSFSAGATFYTSAPNKPLQPEESLMEMTIGTKLVQDELEEMYKLISKQEILDILDEAINEEIKNNNRK